MGRSEKRGTQIRDRRGYCQRGQQACASTDNVTMVRKSNLKLKLKRVCDASLVYERLASLEEKRLLRTNPAEAPRFAALPGHQLVQVPSSFRLLSLGSSLLPHAQ